MQVEEFREPADLSCADVQIGHFSSLRRNHLGVFGKGVLGENPFAKGFSPGYSPF